MIQTTLMRFISRILILVLVFSSFTFSGLAQSFNPMPSMTLPSATATALGSYGAYPVSYANGTVNVSVPLYEIKTSQLTLPISLSCHTNGIKVHEAATNVGLGWSLNAGGVITRQVNDADDFGDNGYANVVIPNDRTPLIEEWDYYYGRASIHTGNTFGGQLKYDSRVDDFFYNYADNSGKFILKNTLAKNGPLSFTKMPYTNTSIDYDKTQKRFTITENDGVVYIFGKSIKDGKAAIETTETSIANYPTSQTDITAWYLTEMISADKSDTVFFKYSGLNYQTPRIYNSRFLESIFNDVTGRESGYTQQFSYSNVSQATIELEEIRYKNGKISFEYGNRDDNSERKIEKIVIYNLLAGNYSQLKSFDFKYSYFRGIDNEGQVRASGQIERRLRLDSIAERGIQSDGTSVTNPPYKFQYHGDGTIATLGSYGQDLWGYWNGVRQDNIFHRVSPQYHDMVADRKGNAEFLIRGTLSSIQYPTGGKTQFTMEPNQGWYDYTTIDTTFKRIDLQTLGAYGTENTDITFTATHDLSTDVLFTAENGCTSGNCITNDPVAYLYDLTANDQRNLLSHLGVGVVISNLPYRSNRTIELLKDHKYRVYFPTPYGYNSSLSPKYRLRLAINKAGIIKIEHNKHNDLVLAGGLRIKKITNNDANGSILKTTEFKYLKEYYVSPDLFRGDFSIVGSRYDFIQQRATGRDWKKIYNENPTVPMAGASNGSIAYEQVEEFETNGADTLGKTVYSFNRQIDDCYDFIPAASTDRNWKRNQLLNKKIFKKMESGMVMLSEQRNMYTDLPALPGDTIKGFIVRRKKDLHDRSVPGYNDPSGMAFGGTEFVCMISGTEVYWGSIFSPISAHQQVYRNVLSSTEDIQFLPSNLNPVSTKTQFFFENSDYLEPSRKEVILSNGDREIERYKYTYDYTSSQCKPNSCYEEYMINLKNLKNSFDIQAKAIYEEWWAKLVRRMNIMNGCFGLFDPWTAPDVPGYDDSIDCMEKNGMQVNDPRIKELYNQYRVLKNDYEANVAQIVNNYKSCKNSYVNCLQNQIATATTPYKALYKMQEINTVELIDDIKTLIPATDQNEYLISASKRNFQLLGNIVKPYQELKTEISNKLLYQTYIAQPENYLNFDMTFELYKDGNLTQDNIDKGPRNAYIWGYNGQYLVAKFNNAELNDVAYCGFESADKGGWTFTAARVKTSSKTGSMSLAFAPNNSSITRAGLDPLKKYIVRFWAKTYDGGLLGYPLLAGPDTNGWALYQIPVTNQTSFTLQIMDSFIDDISICPIDAKMSSMTYDPLVGMTSMTDDTGNITYYEYDALQRLKSIKDQNGNVVKHYDYHFKN